MFVFLSITATQRNVSCRTFEEECVCYWQHDNEASFNDAMATCMSEGGTLFYPNNEEKLVYHEQTKLVIGPTNACDMCDSRLMCLVRLRFSVDLL